MAVYFLRSKHVSRGKGARVTRAAAYRAGERIRDERTSEVYDYSSRGDVAYKEVVLPTDLAGREDMAWTQDRSILWNAAEHAGRRCNSRLAREWLVLLPSEVTAAQRTQLVRTFAKDLADKYRSAIDVCVHEPRPGADSRHHHAHLLMTTREVTPDGMGRRTTLELGGRERKQLGIAGSSRDEYVSIREHWARVTNEALREAGLTARIDHRSLQRQGINREPTPTVPEKVFYAERRSGKQSTAGDAIRARHRERVEARLKGSAELALVVQKQKAQLKERALGELKRREARPDRLRWGALTREERNEKRRERYRMRREVQKKDAAGEAKRREAARAQYRARMQTDPEAVRAARRQWRKEHAGQVNRNQREYRKTNALELAQKRREYRKRLALQDSRKQRAYSQKVTEPSALKSPSATAEESARRWRANLEAYGPGITAEQAARNWLARHEREGLSDPQQSTTPHAYGEKSAVPSTDDEDDDRKRRQRHDYNFEL